MPKLAAASLNSTAEWGQKTDSTPAWQVEIPTELTPPVIQSAVESLP